MMLEGFDDALDKITVGVVDEEMVAYNKTLGKDLSAFEGYYFVEDEDDDRGYFRREEDALGFRLFLINIRLNFPDGGKPWTDSSERELEKD